MEACVEFDAVGNFRIRIDQKCGQWADYTGIALLVYNQTLYIAVSQYHENDLGLPVETVLEVDAIPTKAAVHV
jgi:hypothetical protein